MSIVRVEAMPLNGGYVAVFRSAAAQDEILDGADGRPRIFATAGEARHEGHLALDARTASTATQPDPLRISEWREARARQIEEERRRVFGDDDGVLTRGGREIVVERRRR